MSTKIKIRRDLKQNWQQHNPVLDDGELALIKDTGEIKIGNGQSRVMEIPSINNNFNGYAWELIKEYKPNDIIPASFDIDVNPDDTIIIEASNVDNNIGDTLRLRFNDDTGNNYLYTYVIGGHSLNNQEGTSNKFGLIWNNSISFNIQQINCKHGLIISPSLYKDSNYYIYQQGKRYLGTVPITKLNFFTDNGNTITNVSLKIFKRVQIVAQAPYKKLVASASNINQLNGMVININQDKKYEIEFECNSQFSSDCVITVNGDTNAVYKRSVVGSGSNTNAYSVRDEDVNYLFKFWANYEYAVSNIKVYPTTKIAINEEIGKNSQGIAINEKVYKYNTSNQMNTLNITAPNDNIPCKFKVWEITE